MLSVVRRTDAFDFLVGVLMPGEKPSYLLEAEAAAAALEVQEASLVEGPPAKLGEEEGGVAAAAAPT